MRREITVSLLVGAAAGMLAGLTGVGGGVFLVPLLVGVLYLPQHEAHGTRHSEKLLLYNVLMTYTLLSKSIVW